LAYPVQPLHSDSVSFQWQQLQHLQDQAFPELKGLFPSYRWHPWGYRREDYSAYFTAIILQSLLQLEFVLTDQEKELLENIRLKACEGTSPFRNSHGLDRYNFWGTKPAKHFPNGIIFRHISRLRPPDDADDSVMIYQMQKRPEEQAYWLKKHIDEYANGGKGWVSNCPEEYRELRAWCTFFCRDMPLGFDACVITNILFFNRLYDFEASLKEQESIRFLVQMLKNKDHLRRPKEVAPYYPETATIFVHLARLMASFRIDALEEFRGRLVKEAEKILQNPLRKTERLLMEITWLHLTRSTPPLFLGTDSREPFTYFVLPLTQEYEGGFARWLARKRISHIRFACPAHELALQLEKELLMRLTKAGPRDNY
jgi:hypothetical protein